MAVANTATAPDALSFPQDPEAEAGPDSPPQLPSPVDRAGYTAGPPLGFTVGQDRPDPTIGGAQTYTRPDGWPEHETMSGVAGIIAAGPIMAGDDLDTMEHWGDMLRTARLLPSHPWDTGGVLGLVPPAVPDEAA